MEINWIETIVQILLGLAAVIPLVWQLVVYVEKAVKEKNWVLVLKKLIELMQTAENKFETGADKKEWVLSMLKTATSDINYDIDFDSISNLIDVLCAMAKVINVKK